MRATHAENPAPGKPQSSVDRFGNPIDPTVGYARGRILSSSIAEAGRIEHARQLIRNRAAIHGSPEVAIFTGNQREFPIEPEDIALAEEWAGSAVFAPDLRNAIVHHLGGSAAAHETAVFNRTSGGIVAALGALAPGGRVVSHAARVGAGHVSIRRGASTARAELIETAPSSDLTMALQNASLLVITSMSSELETLETDQIVEAAEEAHRTKVRVFIDDAYGARLRPALNGGPKGLELPVDLVISNSDKAGLEGPRSGFMAGEPALVRATLARASELGLEARAPIALGTLRALERFTPTALNAEIEAGAQLQDQLAAVFGKGRVRATPLGPLISEEDALSIAIERAGVSATDIGVVPCEATCALGMLLLEYEGILTVNSAGQPGARVSLRLKPIPGAIDFLGGVASVVAAVDRAFSRLSEIISDSNAIRRVILGEG